MRAEIRNRLLEVADKKAQQAGMEGLHGFVAEACIVFEKLALALKPLETREGLIAALDSVPLDIHEERFAVPMAEHFEHLVREVLTELFSVGLKDLPPPPGGRRPLLTQELTRNICDYVLVLLGKGVDLTGCKQRAAQRFGVSYPTVQRAWKRRGEASEDATVRELVQFLRDRVVPVWITPGANAGEVIKREYKSLTEGVKTVADT